MWCVFIWKYKSRFDFVHERVLQYCTHSPHTPPTRTHPLTTPPTHTHTYMQGETDEQYLRKVADVMHSLFGTHGTSVLPFFDELLPTFAGMLVSFSTTSLYSSLFVQSFQVAPKQVQIGNLKNGRTVLHTILMSSCHRHC